ncbi:unnamed protein product [Darwinula stevensoni]|nr:unnamed protein product [Darwinula stevensoni]CAG0883843.1 unnamed protein product [Darwinula stevensoni]
MITASHNPKNDNGFKVYWNNGAQIVSPHDKGIQACIEECLEPWETSWDTSVLQMSPLKKDPLPQVMDSYYKYLVAMSYDRQLNANTAIKFTFTPMHGVGEEYVEHAFSVCGFKPFVKVEKQKDPDPDFPTVPFPNPEEGKCALDLAMQAAAEAHSGVILANDPDADRLGVAEKLPNGEWKIFTGNEIGALLGWWLWHCYKHKNPQCDPNDVYMISTAVSSKILAAIAKKEGFHFVETLTGFKWMGNKAEEFMKKGKTVLFAFEEAIGFMCGPRPLDKDGINACIRLAELVAYLEQIEKRSLSEKLLNIYSTYGYHVNRNSYYLTHDPERIKVLFNRLRNFPGSSIGYPERCGTFPIKHVRDLTVGYDSSQVNKKPILPTSKSSQMITFYLENGCVATLRTSGTEPKVKYYAEICTEPDGMDWAALDEIISTVEQHIIEDFMQPSVNGLLPKPV